MITYVITGIVLLVYLLLAWFAGVWLHKTGGEFALLFGLLSLLGVAGTAIFLWYRRKMLGAALPAAASPLASEVDLLVNEAERRLRASRIPGDPSIGNLPLVFVLGDPNTTKTSTILHSGLEPELLAGQVSRDADVTATRSANIWVASKTLFVEVGGQLQSDSVAFARLIKRLQPKRLKAAVGGKLQAPRAALMCFDCEQFVSAGSTDAIPAAARRLGSQLKEISQSFGITLPVYVLFTKADRVPNFADYVNGFTSDEGAQVLGATLRFRPNVNVGVYGEEATRQLGSAYDQLLLSLGEHRLEFLARENTTEHLGGIYEFPREMKKLRQQVVQFLVDLGRPSELSTNPFIRGFYFSGVRAVMVDEMSNAPVQMQAQAAAGGGATKMFSMAEMRAQMAGAAAQPQRVRRKVPQWICLGKFFSQVLLQDRVALGASVQSTKTTTLRRLVYAGAIAACGLVALLWTVSFFKNHALQQQAIAAAQDLALVDSAAAQNPNITDLRKLDTLRQTLATLIDYDRDGAPLMYRLGLYSGSQILSEARHVYFQEFSKLLLQPTQSTIVGELKVLPPAPRVDDYSNTYNELRAYLITTSDHDKSTVAFLRPELMKRWLQGRDVDADRQKLAEDQFGFYAEELKAANPLSSENDGQTVEHARAYLKLYQGIQPIYQHLLAEAGKAGRAVDFNHQFPNGVVFDSHVVPAAFTKEGFVEAKKLLANPATLFDAEQWVIGPVPALSEADRRQLPQLLWRRYQDDFISEWRSFMTSARVVGYGGPADTAAKLGVFSSGNSSPLLQLFWVASRNTAVDDQSLAANFGAPQMVVPPTAIAASLMTDKTQPYMLALQKLQLDYASIARSSSDAGAIGQANGDVTAANQAVGQITIPFPADALGIKGASERLLKSPIPVPPNGDAAALNGGAKQLCASFNDLMQKYPFNSWPTAPQASLAEVNAMFNPAGGQLYSFYNQSVKPHLARQGTQLVKISDLRTTENFRNFLGHALGFADALYPPGAQQPKLAFTMKQLPSKGVDRLALSIGSQTLSGVNVQQQFAWSSGDPVKLNVVYGADGNFTQPDNGPWAIFQFIDRASTKVPAGSPTVFTWNLSFGNRPVTLPDGTPVQAIYQINAPGNVFARSPMHCVAEAAAAR